MTQLKKFIKPIQIGSLKLHSNIFYSPLAGCSDFTYRQMANSYRPGLFFCEMVKIDSLVRNDSSSYRILDYSKEMHPIGAQLCGSNAKEARVGAQIIEDLGFDLLDLNCGCPVDKVTKDGSGSGMLKDLDNIADVLHAMISAVKIPVTLKIRVGWDDDSIVAPQVTTLAESLGATAIFIHGRTREQRYQGLANRDLIKACVDVRKKMPVFGNGDIFCKESAEDMFLRTNCDGILVSRGTLGNPGIVKEIEGDTSLETPYQLLKRHFNFIRRYHPEELVIVEMRKIGSWYLKNGPKVKQLREKLNRAQTLQDVESSIEELEHDTTDL